jgi:hypothetical protein
MCPLVHPAAFPRRRGGDADADPGPGPDLGQKTGMALASTARELHGLLSAQRHLAIGVGGLRAVRRLLSRCGEVGALLAQRRLFQALQLMEKVRAKDLGEWAVCGLVGWADGGPRAWVGKRGLMGGTALPGSETYGGGGGQGLECVGG